MITLILLCLMHRQAKYSICYNIKLTRINRTSLKRKKRGQRKNYLILQSPNKGSHNESYKRSIRNID